MINVIYVFDLTLCLFKWGISKLHTVIMCCFKSCGLVCQSDFRKSQKSTFSQLEIMVQEWLNSKKRKYILYTGGTYNFLFSFSKRLTYKILL